MSVSGIMMYSHSFINAPPDIRIFCELNIKDCGAEWGRDLSSVTCQCLTRYKRKFCVLGECDAGSELDIKECNLREWGDDAFSVIF